MTADQRAEELASDLGADKEEVKRDLENLLEYSVPVEEAVQSLRRKYGGGGGESATPEPASIGEITVDDAAATVTARVLTKGRRSIRYQGEERVIREGVLADGTGRIPYTAWTEVPFEAGDTVTVGNASVREWDGHPELNIGESTTVTVEPEPLDVPYEVGGGATLAELSPGDRGATVEVVVLEIDRKTIDGRDGETEILSGVVADDTARLPFTDWAPRAEVVEGASLRLEDVYVREFRGVPSVNCSEFTVATPLDRDIEPAGATQLSIREAVESGGAFDAAVRGHVIGIRDGSGLIQRCPECGRLVQKGQCRSHGAVEGEDDLRVKAIVDDGTGTVTAILDDELTAAVYGGTLDDAREAAREAMDQSVVADAIAERIVGREYRVRGNVSVDEYGANLVATAFDPIDDDPAERARELLAAVDG